MSIDSLVHVNIYVNNICEKGCKLCYYPKGSVEISKDRAFDIAKWIIEDQIVPENYMIHFLGGESLNSFDRILDIVDYAIAHKPNSSSWIFEKPASIFTNGDLLTEITLKEVKKRNIAIILNPTYDTMDDIRKKVELVKSVCGGCSFSIVMDDMNMSRIEDLTKLALDYDCNIRTNRLYDGGRREGYVEAYKQSCLKMLNILLESEKVMRPTLLIENTAPIYTYVARYGKGLISYFVAIDPDGNIRNCSADIDTVVGNIYTHSLTDLKSVCSHDNPGCYYWHTNNIPECQSCEWEWICHGGCPYTRKLAYGSYDIKSPFCSAFKELFPLLMKMVERWVDKTGEKEK